MKTKLLVLCLGLGLGFMSGGCFAQNKDDKKGIN